MNNGKFIFATDNGVVDYAVNTFFIKVPYGLKNSVIDGINVSTHGNFQDFSPILFE